MSEPSDFEKMMDQAPPGEIMRGIISIHKTAAGRIWMVTKIGDQVFKKEIQRVFIKAIAGKGPMGKVFGRFFGGTGTPALEVVPPAPGPGAPDGVE